ncbi:MAG: DUF2330 domain-containing protein [Sandaracinaceae bacterium]
MNRGRAVATAVCVLIGVTPAPVLACGGFFCSSAPIDQAGETIVYGLEDDGTLTMSIQIRYSGDDDDFAWILPVVAPPEISLGSDALFTAIEAATRPTFGISDVTEGSCRLHPTCVFASSCLEASDSGCGGGAPSSGWTGGYVDASAPPPAADSSVALMDAGTEPGVTVYSRGPVGPYETVVLGAATAQEVVDWLREYNYDVADSSVPLLETYAAAGQVFVALRLRSDARTRTIQPITLRMPTAEVCLPIRLTAIATVPDMPIRAFFLGREQVRAANYNTAIVDTSDVAFYDGRATYPGAVRQRIGELGGHAFATDYAGPTPAVSLALPSVSDLSDIGDAGLFLRRLADRGYRGDAQLLDVLEAYVTAPAEWTGSLTDYYNCLFSDGTAACGEPAVFDPVGLTAAIEAEITQPRADAEALVHRHAYLTRLYTSMSAEDMTIDPVFVADGDLPPQPAVHIAERVTRCAPQYFAEDAPQVWRIGGDETPIHDGTPADDHAYCAARGAVPISEAPECAGDSSSRGGCLCAVGGTAPIQGGVLLGVALLLFGRRHRRAR